MTLNEAVDMVDQVCSQVSLNRQGHIQVQVAINIIRQTMSAPIPTPEAADTTRKGNGEKK